MQMSLYSNYSRLGVKANYFFVRRFLPGSMREAARVVALAPRLVALQAFLPALVAARAAGVPLPRARCTCRHDSLRLVAASPNSSTASTADSTTPRPRFVFVRAMHQAWQNVVEASVKLPPPPAQHFLSP